MRNKSSLADRILLGLSVTFAAIACVGFVLHYTSFSKEENPYRYFDVKHTPPRITAPAQKIAPRNLASTNQEKVEIITLSATNSVTLDEAFTDESVNVVMRDMFRLSQSNKADATLYLVLNTPGGSIDAGLKLISFLKALPQKVKTVTIFAASMGFMTAQELDERLILEHGTLMSHRARFGVQGQYPGEIHSRMKWIQAMIDGLELSAAKRMELSYADYRQLVHDEYWVFDSKAVADKAADRKVLAKCAPSLMGVKRKNIETFFGSFQVHVSQCPLIPGVVELVSARPPRGTDEQQQKALNYVKLMFSDRAEFSRRFVVTNKFQEFQK